MSHDKLIANEIMYMILTMHYNNLNMLTQQYGHKVDAEVQTLVNKTIENIKDAKLLLVTKIY